METSMKYLSNILAAGVLLAATPAIALAMDEESRSFDLPDFDRIDVSAGVMLVADVGGTQSVLVKTNNGDFSDFEIEVDDGELTISREWNRLSWHGSKSDYKVIITVPRLTGLEASSGSHARIMKVDAKRFTIDASSGAHMSIDGACETCVIDLSSGADLDAKDLLCNEANIDVSSGGHGKITVRDAVVGDASSGGHVSVYGNPRQVNIDKSSGGRIKIISTSHIARD